ncbi:MAG: hypothetical protein GY927_07135 [bacterium]|nr:hypothetical protein [bacterium]
MEQYMLLLKGAGWLVLALLAFTLVFTKDIVNYLGMENTLQSVLIVILPLVFLAAGIELITRRLK